MVPGRLSRGDRGASCGERGLNNNLTNNWWGHRQRSLLRWVIVYSCNFMSVLDSGAQHLCITATERLNGLSRTSQWGMFEKAHCCATCALDRACVQRWWTDNSWGMLQRSIYYVLHFPQKIYKLSKTNTFFSHFEGMRGEKPKYFAPEPKIDHGKFNEGRKYKSCA